MKLLLHQELLLHLRIVQLKYRIKPVFVDINSQNITLKTINQGINKKTKAVILVHLAGWPCELKELCTYIVKKIIFG